MSSHSDSARHLIIKPFALAFFSTVIAIFIADRFFPDVMRMAACALIALGLYPLMQNLLQYNREAIWLHKSSPYSVNRKLCLELSAIFFGIFIAGLVLGLVRESWGANAELHQAYRNDFAPLLKHNLGVLLAGTLFSLLYRAGGLVLVLGWNALHWSESIFGYIFKTSQEVDYSTAAILAVVLLPHLIIEVLAYVLAGMGGVFLSSAITKYKLSSIEFQQVFRACAVLLLVSVLLLSVAVSLEIFFAQNLFHYLTA